MKKCNRNYPLCPVVQKDLYHLTEYRLDSPVGMAASRVANIFQSRLFNALLDIQDYYELHLNNKQTSASTVCSSDTETEILNLFRRIPNFASLSFRWQGTRPVWDFPSQAGSIPPCHAATFIFTFPKSFPTAPQIYVCNKLTINAILGAI